MCLCFSSNDLKGQEFIIDSDVDNLEMEEDKEENSEGASNSKEDSGKDVTFFVISIFICN